MDEIHWAAEDFISRYRQITAFWVADRAGLLVLGVGDIDGVPGRDEIGAELRDQLAAETVSGIATKTLGQNVIYGCSPDSDLLFCCATERAEEFSSATKKGFVEASRQIAMMLHASVAKVIR